MRTGAAAGHTGYFHETAVYGSDEELVAIARPFLQDGIDAREPTVVACGPRTSSLLRRVVGGGRVRFLEGDNYQRPGPTIRAYRRLLSDLLAGGAPQVRVVGEVPHPGTGADWRPWQRYEAATNVAFDDLPLWGLCAYDTRTAPHAVLSDVECTHPYVATADGSHHRNPSYVDPVTFLDRRLADAPGTDRLGTPDLRLTDPTPRTARRELVACARDRLDSGQLEDLAMVASELVANAHHHGAPPVVVQAWLGPGRVEVSVADAGPGPRDPLVGLVPPGAGVGGRGLWIAHQLCTDIRIARRRGCEVVFTVGAAAPAPTAA